MKSLAGLCGWMLCAVLASAEAPLTLNDKRIRLGPSGAPEWEEFAADPPHATRFEVRFQSEPNAGEATLFIRQKDVKQEWPVELNGKRVGKLFLMEADLVHTIAVPPGALRQGENVLLIRPSSVQDDIVVHEIKLDRRSPLEARNEATLAINVTDREGQALPCRITAIDERGTLAPIIAAPGDASPPAVRPGVAYTGSGRARLGLPRGRYTVFAARGFEIRRGQRAARNRRRAIARGKLPARLGSGDARVGEL